MKQRALTLTLYWNMEQGKHHRSTLPLDLAFDVHLAPINYIT